ncbi:hypothetical protein BCR36DRAFT_50978 [Piromyces finnis]|uniref:Uncharacterized protein n=1 Tax=Piromyces finnis TaxID=1754191 RepID=A0A1Y1VME6_9FUNG|nr:hypothetical protein BCR36DRAFT_50978 [Piromyces finnis]|eukprot:ORX60093.1 hypothetical protein BCR36DRAFT_50978 [Piromyces finnis]
MNSRLNKNKYKINYNTNDRFNIRQEKFSNNLYDIDDECSNEDDSYYNFEVLKQLNRDFLYNDTNISNPSYSKKSTVNDISSTTKKQNLPNMNNKIFYNNYEEKRAKELKQLISKMNNIINEEYSYNKILDEEEEIEEEEEEEEEEDYDSKYYNENIINYRGMKNIDNINKNRLMEKEKILKQFNKDLLNLSSMLEKKKKQLNNKEKIIKQRESKIKAVLTEFNRMIKEDKEWKKDIENLRRDYQTSINILSKENKQLIESLQESSSIEEELKLELKEKEKEIKELKMKNEIILEEKNKIQNVTSELKIEITQLKEKIKDMQDSNTILHQNFEKLSKKEKEKKNNKNVEITVKPETNSIEVQTENSNLLEKIINQQYMDIKRLFTLYHYILTLYNKNNMEENEYRKLWNDIRAKFFKNKELKDIKICNYIPYILNYSLKKENIINLFENKHDHFIKLLLEFIMDYMNENSIKIEQKLKIVHIILKYGTIIPNTNATHSLIQNNSPVPLPSPYECLKNYPTILAIPSQILKKFYPLTSLVNFDLNYDKESHIYLYFYLISLYSYQEIVETKENFISTLSEQADTISYLLIFIFNGLINELTTSELQ